MKRRISFQISLTVVFCLISSALGATRLVPSEYSTIQAAIDDCNDGDTVIVADGTYTGAGNRDIDFNDLAITVRSENGPDNCIIDCNGSASDIHRGFIFQGGEVANSVLEGVTIKNGYVFENGGGIYCSSDPTIKNCIITNNTVIEDPCNPSLCFGAGIKLNGSNATIIGCEITSNSSPDNCFGGGIYCTGNPTIKSCIIKNNTTEGRGGGMCTSAGTADIINCLIVGNTASLSEYGGGIACKNSTPNIVNCTISENSAGRGGAIDIISATATITNCILWDNSIDEIYCTDTGTAIVTYSNIEGGYSGTGNINANPLFASSGDYHLTFGSPSIDAGTDSPPGGLEPNDIEGNSRPFDGDLDSTATTDMGAYEFHCNPGDPIIAITPASFKFSCPVGGPDPNSRTLYIWNPGGETLYWQLTEDANWLSANPASGQCTVETDEVALSMDSSGLDSDLYNCTITIADVCDGGNTRLVEVDFRVGPTIYVPSDHNNIQAAIDAAFDGDTIVVADGNYTGTGNRDIDFKGKAITVRSENGPENCIINCEGSSSDIHRGFYFHSGEDKDSILDGFAIINGYHRGTSLSEGGGILCLNEGTEPTIRNCIIKDCVAECGGGVSCYRGNPRIMNCTIVGNTAYTRGGGIYFWDKSYADITGCTIADNSVIFGGGAIYSGYNSNPEIASSIIWNNNSSSGAYEIYGSATVSYSDVKGGYSGSGNINTDPCFVDPSSDDYHLFNNSPCIDAGDPCYSPMPDELDIDGEPRVMGQRIDMGSDEISDMLADFDENGTVDMPDINVMSATWVGDPCDSSWNENCDLDQDGFITFTDYVLFAQNYGKEVDNESPTAPTNLTITDTTTSTISLSWTASTDNVGVAGYKIYRHGDYINYSYETNFIDIGLDPATIYTYTVTAYDAIYNESGSSDPCQVTTD